MNINTISGSKFLIDNISFYDLETTLNCGQCFRWLKNHNKWTYTMQGKSVDVSQDNNFSLTFENTTLTDINNIWLKYFDLYRDYDKITKILIKDSIMKKAFDFCKGIHILNQEPFETLCSFIISQNNNIPRIKGIISRLCENFGEKINDTLYSFPSPSVLACLSVDDLSVIRSGFRAKYLIDAAKKVDSKEIDFSTTVSMSYLDAAKYLMQIKGVGPKVADCALLFSLGFFNAFPKDVWIIKAMAHFYSDGLPEFLEPYGGLVQQYIYHYARMYPNAFNSI